MEADTRDKVWRAKYAFTGGQYDPELEYPLEERLDHEYYVGIFDDGEA